MPCMRTTGRGKVIGCVCQYNYYNYVCAIQNDKNTDLSKNAAINEKRDLSPTYVLTAPQLLVNMLIGKIEGAYNTVGLLYTVKPPCSPKVMILL